MNKEFKLSKKRRGTKKYAYYDAEDVKEFIRLLKEEINMVFYKCKDELSQTSLIIDTLAGKELTQ